MPNTVTKPSVKKIQLQVLSGGCLIWLIITALMPSLTPSGLDSILHLATNGNWLLTDEIQYSISIVFILALTHQILPYSQWPWQFFIFWLPYGIWASFSVIWSIYSGYSMHESVHEVWLPISIFLFSFVITKERVFTLSQIYSALLCITLAGALAVVVTNETTPGSTRHYFDKVLFGNWLSYTLAFAMIGSIPFLKSQQNINSAIYLLICSIILGATLGSRMFWLSAIPIWLFITYITKNQLLKNRNRATFWVIIFIIICAMYIFTAAPKKSNELSNLPQQWTWLSTLFNNERYAMWNAWFNASQSNWITGTGLGWELPGMAYSQHLPDWMSNTMMASHGHNLFLNVYLQLGLIGFFLYSLFFALMQLHAHRTPETAESIQNGFMLMLLILIGKNFSDDGMRDQNISYYFSLIGFIFGHNNQAQIKN
ncbi:O-antigen ligase family protein [Deefgea tanakiae]|uniref:O-antigen ligase family protein n=1 Tax=Deefgea tanakiae TaxID=2865840 RepID=A0ABX8Z7E3_9NEIS|nr:O-antigen ligase family protein [Deefgea tanakiae]QZA76834.1 O-antigen ligase family protein [Deefgea tanakiae]